MSLFHVIGKIHDDIIAWTSMEKTCIDNQMSMILSFVLMNITHCKDSINVKLPSVSINMSESFGSKRRLQAVLSYKMVDVNFVCATLLLADKVVIDNCFKRGMQTVRGHCEELI